MSNGDWDERWEEVPDIAALLKKKAKNEQTVTANVGVYERPLGKPMKRQPVPKKTKSGRDEKKIHPDVAKYLKGDW